MMMVSQSSILRGMSISSASRTALLTFSRRSIRWWFRGVAWKPSEVDAEIERFNVAIGRRKRSCSR